MTDFILAYMIFLNDKLYIISIMLRIRASEEHLRYSMEHRANRDARMTEIQLHKSHRDYIGSDWSKQRWHKTVPICHISIHKSSLSGRAYSWFYLFLFNNYVVRTVLGTENGKKT